LPEPYPGFEPRGDLWRSSRGDAWLFAARVEGAFDGAVQADIVAALEEGRERLVADCPECRLQATGAVLFAADAQQRARFEVMLISGLSLSAIVLLVLASFGGPRPLLLGVLALAAAVLVAVAASVAVFGRLHLITLVAGTTLLGTAIDYVIKYSVHRGDGGDAKALARRLRLPLGIGLATSLACFMVLMLSPFPALRQIAVFSATGLFMAWFTVIALFPLIDRGRGARLRPRVAAALAAPTAWLGRRRVPWWILPAVLVPLALLAAGQQDAREDVRAFQAVDDTRLAQDRAVRERIGSTLPEGIFVIEGEDVETVLRREEALRERLVGRAALSVTRVLPSAARQAEVHSNIGRGLADPVLAEGVAALGLPPDLVAGLRAEWEAARGRGLGLQTARATPLGPLVDGLWLDGTDTMASLLPAPRAGGGGGGGGWGGGG
jgi:predicted exporter